MTRQEVFKKMESGLSEQGQFKRRISQYETKYSRKFQDMAYFCLILVLNVNQFAKNFSLFKNGKEAISID